MKYKYTTVDGRFGFEVDADNEKEFFSAIQHFEEIFVKNGKCGICSQPAEFHVREADGYTFYEAWCSDYKCKAKLQFGQKKQTNELFPRRKDEKTGELIGKFGWAQYQPNKQAAVAADEGKPAPAQTTAAPAKQNNNARKGAKKVAEPAPAPDTDDVPF